MFDNPDDFEDDAPEFDGPEMETLSDTDIDGIEFSTDEAESGPFNLSIPNPFLVEEEVEPWNGSELDADADLYEIYASGGTYEHIGVNEGTSVEPMFGMTGRFDVEGVTPDGNSAVSDAAGNISDARTGEPLSKWDIST